MSINGTDDAAAHAARELATLEAQEREISDRRAGLHRQIDEVYLRAPLDPADMALLDRLEDLERLTSAERRALHARIDALRVQVGRAPGPTRSAA